MFRVRLSQGADPHARISVSRSLCLPRLGSDAGPVSGVDAAISDLSFAAVQHSRGGRGLLLQPRSQVVARETNNGRLDPLEPAQSRAGDFDPEIASNRGGHYGKVL